LLFSKEIILVLFFSAVLELVLLLGKEADKFVCNNVAVLQELYVDRFAQRNLAKLLLMLDKNKVEELNAALLKVPLVSQSFCVGFVF
jgi:hypothetical protein